MSCERTTRSQISCPVFGAPEEFCGRVLPTYYDVMKHFLFVKTLEPFNKRGVPPRDVANRVAEDLIQVWEKASIPTSLKKSVVDRICSYHKQYAALLKTISSLRENFKEEKQSEFLRESKKLFDVCVCKCRDMSQCKCPKSRKVPAQEWSFLVDQRTTRKMAIGDIDLKTTTVLQKRSARKESDSMAFNVDVDVPEESQNTASNILNLSTDSVVSAEISIGEHWEQPSASSSGSNRNLVQIENFAVACDRVGVSDRKAAILANAIMKDRNILTPETALDKNKIRRHREKIRKKTIVDSSNKFQNLHSLYFDGRKDTTMVMGKSGEKSSRKLVQEEHYVMLREPGSIYLGHVSPNSGTGQNIALSMVEYLQTNKTDISQIIAVGCDGTPINTGRKNGSIRSLENKIGHPVQWLVCLLHANELPLRHLVEKLDGATTGPSTFSGPIGKLLPNCLNFPVVNFDAIENEMTLQDLSQENLNLSTDQKYLFDICLAVKRGECSTDLAARDPGALSKVRWLTMANRLLRLYIGTENPSENLKNLATYVMKVYIPMWCQIKRYSNAAYGAGHIFRLIQLVRGLPENVTDIVFPVIQRNSFFAHPENILIKMITDDRDEIRQTGWERIFQCNRTLNNREFLVPQLNFSAEDYYEMIDWGTVAVTFPPLLKNLEAADIQKLRAENAVFYCENMPCHTQAVERHVKIVTEASSSVCGEERRHGLIETRLKSRKLMPKLESKKDFQ